MVRVTQKIQKHDGWGDSKDVGWEWLLVIGPVLGAVRMFLKVQLSRRCMGGGSVWVPRWWKTSLHAASLTPPLSVQTSKQFTRDNRSAAHREGVLHQLIAVNIFSAQWRSTPPVHAPNSSEPQLHTCSSTSCLTLPSFELLSRPYLTAQIKSHNMHPPQHCQTQLRPLTNR